MRPATEDDLPEIVRMGIAFCEHLGQPHDTTVMESTARGLIVSDDGVLLIDEGAMAGALIYQHFFSDQRVAQELFWWVDPEHRGGGKAMTLLRGLESWADEHNARSLTMISMGDGVERIYEKNGYRPFEKTYVKVF